MQIEKYMNLTRSKSHDHQKSIYDRDRKYISILWIEPKEVIQALRR